jgi:hypothetical protein
MRRTTSLSIGISKANVICCAIRGHPQLGFRCFMSTTAATTSGLRPLGPGFIGSFDENRRRYFRWISARCKLNSVDGLKTIAERINRPRRIKTAHRPATTRSVKRRLGDRFRERLRISSWCLTSTDSATTERAPPGPASRTTVASRCRNRTARSCTAGSYQDRDSGKECAQIWNSLRTRGNVLMGHQMDFLVGRPVVYFPSMCRARASPRRAAFEPGSSVNASAK